jgi:hypothetical protein
MVAAVLKGEAGIGAGARRWPGRENDASAHTVQMRRGASDTIRMVAPPRWVRLNTRTPDRPRTEHGMRTAIIILSGLGALALCLYLARRFGKPGGTAVSDTTLAFVTVWFLAAATNMWIGLTRAGYTWREELPVFVAIFGIPAATALVAKRRLS